MPWVLIVAGSRPLMAIYTVNVDIFAHIAVISTCPIIIYVFSRENM